MSIDDSVSKEEKILSNKEEIITAATEVANKFKKEYEKLGYHLSYGYNYNDIGEKVIGITAQYTSWKRHIYMFGSERIKEKARALMPETYEYNGKIISIQFPLGSVGKFL